MLGVHRQILSRVLQLITIRAAITEIVVAATEMPRLALPPRKIAPTRTAGPARAAAVGNVGQFVHQCAASSPPRSRHAVVQQVAAQRDAAGEGTAMHLGRQVIPPAHLNLRRQCAQQPLRQQRLHVGQGLAGQLLLRSAQPCRVELQALSCRRGVGGQQ